MTKEEKTLLLKDLCARLPYHVELWSPVAGDNWAILTPVIVSNLFSADLSLPQVKPYLRPMSSMTDEEKKIMRSCGFEPILYDTGYAGFANIEYCIDEVSFRFMEEFLNTHHFDYRGLIEKGLALEAPVGMYKF